MVMSWEWGVTHFAYEVVEHYCLIAPMTPLGSAIVFWMDEAQTGYMFFGVIKSWPIFLKYLYDKQEYEYILTIYRLQQVIQWILLFNSNHYNDM